MANMRHEGRSGIRPFLGVMLLGSGLALFGCEFLANAAGAEPPVNADKNEKRSRKEANDDKEREPDAKSDTTKKSSEAERQDDRDSKSGTAFLERELKTLREDSRRLRDQVDTMTRSVAGTVREAETIKAKTDAARERQQQLAQTLAKLEIWQKADLILGDAQSDAAIAVKLEGGKITLAGSVRGPDVRSYVNAASNAHRPVVASKLGREIARHVATEGFADGDMLSNADQALIFDQVWRKPHPFLAADELQPKFVVFRHVDGKSQSIGIFGGVEGNVLRYGPVGQEFREVRREDIEPGTLRADFGTEILDSIEADDAYYDYCALGISHALGIEARQPGYRAVGLHVNLDGIIGTLNQVDIERVRKYELQPTDRMRTALPYIPMPAGSNSGWEGWTANMLTAGANLGMSIGERSSGSWDYSVIERDRNADLKKKARQVEDDFYLRLYRCGLPLVEKEHFDEVRNARKADYYSSSSGSAGKMLNASHLVVVDVSDPPKGRPAPVVNVRLVDVSDGRVLWVANSAALAPRPIDQNPFFPVSGTLCTLKRDPNLPKDRVVELHGFEDRGNEEFKVGLTTNGATTPVRQLVLLEGETETDYLYRSLFYRKVHAVPKKHVELRTFEKGMMEAATDPELASQQARCIVWHLASSALQPAGRITEAIEDGRSYRVSIGSLHGITSDTILRCYRPHVAGSDTSVPTDVTLSVALAVKDVQSDTCIVRPRRIGIGGYWEDENMLPRVGDYVYDPYQQKKRKIAVFPPEGIETSLSEKEAYTLSGGNVNYWNAIVAKQRRLGTALQQKLVGGLIALDAAYEDKGLTETFRFGYGRSATFVSKVDVSGTVLKAINNGATHALGGYIRPSTNAKNKGNYDVEFRLYLLKRDGNNGLLEETKVALPPLKLGANQWN